MGCCTPYAACRKTSWRCFLAAVCATFTLQSLSKNAAHGMISFTGVHNYENRDWLMQLPFILINAGACAPDAVCWLMKAHVFGVRLLVANVKQLIQQWMRIWDQCAAVAVSWAYACAALQCCHAGVLDHLQEWLACLALPSTACACGCGSCAPARLAMCCALLR